MCFLILEHDQRPMKIRGEQVIAATIIPMKSDAVSAGLYIGTRSGHVLEVKHLGLLADTVPASRPAYAAMQAVGVTLGKFGAEAQTDDVYVPLEQSYFVQAWQGILTTSSWPYELSDYWLPATFEIGAEQAEGWFRVKLNQEVEALVIGGWADKSNIATIKPRYAVNLTVCITGIECLNEWNTKRWASQSFSAKQAVTA